jgi:urea ABC transporter ATP-binding protein UrtD
MSAVVLETRRLSRRFGGVVAVEDVNLEIHAGEIHCIIGPNGAGKSTLLNMLCGILRPSSGSIRYLDQDLVGLPIHRFAHRGIARKFQVPSIFATLSAWDNLAVASFHKVQTDWGPNQAIETMLERLGLVDHKDKLAGELAHGQKQWLEIGMALMTEPKLLLLDEPTAGMTAEETQKTAKLLLTLRGQLSMVAIEHDMSFVRALNCHTIVMHQGRLIAGGEFQTIERNETVRDIYLGRH